MVRTVRVRLELDRQDFKQGLRDSATDMRAFDAEVKTLGQSSERTGTQLKETGVSSRKLADDVKASKVETLNLGKELETTRGKLKDLGAEYQRTGSVELDRYRSLTSELRKLERAKRDLDKLLPGQNQQGGLLGGGAGSALNAISGAGLTGAFSSGTIGGLSPLASQALVAGAVAAGPAISAALSGAVLVGLGGATLALGIKSAVDDPRVKAAFSGLGAEVKADLQDAASSFVGPLIDATGTFRTAWQGVLPQLKGDFDTLAPSIDHLASGMSGLAVNAMPGFNDAIQAAAPLLNQLGDDTLPRMGAALGFFFDRIAAAGPGAQAFFRDLTTVADVSIGALGLLIEIGSKLYQFWHDVPLLGSGVIEWLTQLDGGGKKAKSSFNDLSAAQLENAAAAQVQAAAQAQANEALMTAKGRSDALKQSLDGAFASQIAATDATERFNGALLGLTESVKANGASLDMHTRAGLANRDAIEAAAQASVDLMLKDIANGVSLDEATKKHQHRIDTLKDESANTFHQKQVTDDLISSYGEVPGDVHTNVRLTGADAVRQQLMDLKVAQLALFENIDIPAARKELFGSGGHASGGLLSGPGSGTSDSLVIRASAGEYVTRASSVDYYGKGLLDALNVRAIPREMLAGYALGGMVWPNTATFIVDASHTKIPFTLAQLQAKYSTGIGAGPGGNWTAVATAVANALGQPGSVGAILRRIAFESGGNPTVVNTTDSNWFAGHPSVGLAQVIAGTYAAYVDGHDVGPYEYGVSVNPFANVFAGMNYATHRYGSIAAVDPLNMPSGYAHGGLIGAQSFDRGGWLQPGWTAAYNGTRYAERVGGAASVINLTVNAGMGTDGYQVGQQVVEHLRSWLNRNGNNVQLAIVGRQVP